MIQASGVSCDIKKRDQLKIVDIFVTNSAVETKCLTSAVAYPTTDFMRCDSFLWHDKKAFVYTLAESESFTSTRMQQACIARITFCECKKRPFLRGEIAAIQMLFLMWWVILDSLHKSMYDEHINYQKLTLFFIIDILPKSYESKF